MPQYAVSRSLFIEVWLSLAASRAGVTSPTDRRALGLVYSQMNVGERALRPCGAR